VKAEAENCRSGNEIGSRISLVLSEALWQLFSYSCHQKQRIRDIQNGSIAINNDNILHWALAPSINDYDENTASRMRFHHDSWIFCDLSLRNKS
jgi:hypothetical protein